MMHLFCFKCDDEKLQYPPGRSESLDGSEISAWKPTSDAAVHPFAFYCQKSTSKIIHAEKFLFQLIITDNRQRLHYSPQSRRLNYWAFSVSRHTKACSFTPVFLVLIILLVTRLFEMHTGARDAVAAHVEF